VSTQSVATLSELRTLARQYADMVNSQFVTDDEFNSYLNLAYFELYDILIQKYGDDYYATSYQFTTDGTTQQYPLPSDFYKFLGLDLQLSPSSPQNGFITIRPFMFGDRNRYSIPNMQTFAGITNLRYRVFSNTLFLTPIPAGNQTLKIWYVPKLNELTTDASTVDGISGWQDYLPLEAAIKALIKEETDVSMLMARKQALISRIEAAAENRDAGNPQVVTDSQYTDFWTPNTGYWNGAF